MYELWKQGVIHLGDLLITLYKRLGMDETTYTFLLIFSRLIKESPSSWSLAEIEAVMTIDTRTCSQIFVELIQKGFVLVENGEDVDGKRYEKYSLAPLFLKIEAELKKEKHANLTTDLKELSAKIEQLFGVLSSKDLELVNMWLSEDGFDAPLIELALSEMQLYDIRSLKYVDKILLDWKRKNIYTVEEAKRSLIDFRSRRSLAQAPKEDVSLNPADYYDWMEEAKQRYKG
ncbi:MAG: DnaD domain protein [Turicibacter sp.]|nr:DnaD domain protein [Turicibacter sp.]